MHNADALFSLTKLGAIQICSDMERTAYSFLEAGNWRVTIPGGEELRPVFCLQSLLWSHSWDVTLPKVSRQVTPPGPRRASWKGGKGLSGAPATLCLPSGDRARVAWDALFWGCRQRIWRREQLLFYLFILVVLSLCLFCFVYFFSLSTLSFLVSNLASMPFSISVLLHCNHRAS